ncbi:elongation factor G [bacterium]|nr:MAG: elongation factor G [bacterium]
MGSKVVGPDKIRNIALLSHGGAGKTTLVEAMLYTAGMISKMGSVEQGNTVSDFHQIEIERKSSVNISIMHIMHDDKKINILDTPGYTDFIGELISAIRVVEAGVIVVSAQASVEVGTQKAWDYLEEKPRIVFINKMDRENADFNKVLSDLKDYFGDAIVPFTLPIGAADTFVGVVDLLTKTAYQYEKGGKGKGKKIDVPAEIADDVEKLHTTLVERAAESDEKLMEKYFDEGTLSADEIAKGLLDGIMSGEIVPVYTGSAALNMGIDLLIDAIIKFVPSPALAGPVKGAEKVGGELTLERKPSPDEPFSALVFKLITEPHVGDLTYFRIYSGRVKPGEDVLNPNVQTTERIGQLFVSNGKNREDVPELLAGDIGVTVKLKNTKTGHTLCDKKEPIVFPPIEFPEPLVAEAVVPKQKGEEDKIAQGLARLHDEDPTFFFNVDPELKQTIVYGQGEVHLELVVRKLRERFKVDVELRKPRIPYRETITAVASDRYRHKKQTGGAGEFAEIELRIEPLERGAGFEYGWEVFGGAISSGFQGSIEKGIKQAMSEGVLAGYPIIDLKAVVVDGKEHPVDSKDIAFQRCAREVFRRAFMKAKPILLEPIMDLEIIVPEEFTGDVMGDISARRGRILGVEPVGKKLQKIIAKVPQAELYKYSSTLRSMTQGRGWFTQKFSHYEPVPKEIADKIIAEAKAAKEE